MNISTQRLKEIATQMEDSPAKKLILCLPNDVSKDDLVAKFDLILQFLQTEKQNKGVAKK